MQKIGGKVTKFPERAWQTMGLWNIVTGFTGNMRGNVAMMFALLLVPVILAVGAAIDYSRASQQKVAFQTALDASALALGLMPVDATQAEIEIKAADVFDANFAGTGTWGTSIVAVKTGSSVDLSLAGNIDTMFMGLANIHTLDMHVNSEVLIGGGTIEVAMVLDNSGSMSGAKLSALKVAASGLVDTLYDGLPSNTTDLSFSLTPFAAFVDIGESHANDPWMDRFGQSSIHNENFNTPSNRFDLFNNITNVQWDGCVEARPYPHDVQDSTPSSSDPDTLFVPAFAPDQPDNGGPGSKYRSRYLSDQTSGSWQVRQQNVAKYTPGSWANTGYYGTSRNIGPSLYCRVANMIPLTTSQSTITDGISGMFALGTTNIVHGLVWGWRALSPSEPFTQGRAYTDNRNQKILILLTDGANYLGSSGGSPNNSRYSAYGYARAGRLGTVSASSSLLTDRMDDRTAEACQNIKNSGVTVYTITFDLNDSDTINLMRNCATSAQHYFNSPSASDLDDVFEEIALQLRSLRLVR